MITSIQELARAPWISYSHIGDGVYAAYDGYQIILATERENGIHWMVLEPSAITSLHQYVERLKSGA